MSRSPAGSRIRKLLGVTAFFLIAAPPALAQPSPDDVFRYLALDYPGLEKVRDAVAGRDFPRARAELLSYFQTRADRLGTGLYATGEGKPALAYENAANNFSWKGTSKAFGKSIDWTFTGLDREWNYSLNRMLWFENLVEVYSRTREESLVRAWKEQLMSWIRIGDPGFPRTIDTGRRLESLASSYCMFITRFHTPSVSPEENALLLASIHQQCEYLYNPDHWRRYSNWGTFETSGFARAAVLFPEFRRSRAWLQELFFRMQVQITFSYYPDGMHVELSPSYHAGELQMWYEFVRLAELNGIVNPWLTQSAQPSPAALFRGPARALSYLLTPTGEFVRAGDTDSRQESLHLLDGMSLYLADPHLRFVATGGEEGSPPEEPSGAFPDAGYFALRGGWGDAQRPFSDQLYLLFDATLNTPWHAHRDALNVLLSAFGRDLLVDAGRFTYNEGPERELFLSAASHNTVVIDGADQKKHDPKPESAWSFFRSFDCVSASRLQGVVEHKRTVCLVRPDYVVVVDQLTGKGSHQYRQYWHLNPDASGRVSQSGSTVLSPNLLLSSSLPRGSLALETGPVSYRYRERTEGPVVTCSWKDSAGTAAATLFYPFRGEAPRVIFRDMTVPGSRGWSATFQVDREHFKELIYVRSDSAIDLGAGVTTDADLLFLRRDAGGTVKCFTAVRGSYLLVDGKLHWRTAGVKADVSFDGEYLEIRGKNVRRFEARIPLSCTILLNGENISAKAQGEMVICE